eukprot:8004448-Lingulodinium_polyedra.AAC.1
MEHPAKTVRLARDPAPGIRWGNARGGGLRAPRRASNARPWTLGGPVRQTGAPCKRNTAPSKRRPRGPP